MALLNRPLVSKGSSTTPADKPTKVLGFIPKRLIVESGVITVAVAAVLLDSKLMSRLSARSRTK